MIQWTENVETNGNENCIEAQKYEIKKFQSNVIFNSIFKADF